MRLSSESQIKTSELLFMRSSFTSLMVRFKHSNLLSALLPNTSVASANTKDDNHLFTCPIKRKNVRRFLASGVRGTGELCIVLSDGDVGLGLLIND